MCYSIDSKVKVIVDRPLGSRHPEHGFIYPVNYGYVPGTLAGDGEEIDAYILGEFEPLDSFEGNVIGLIVRNDDNENKLVVSRYVDRYGADEIKALTEFQERFFDSHVISFVQKPGRNRQKDNPMREGDVFQNTKIPATVESLQSDFRALGVRAGMVLMVHSSLSAMGWVCGGAVAIILALQEVLGAAGTLVMPAHSTDLTEPSEWQNPPVPESWWQVIRASMPAYHPDLTPTRSMGVIAETFRKQNGVLRSAHPHHSFCARGPQASYITDNHSLAFGMGEGSPLARIYDLDGYVLLQGVGYNRNTSMHLAEYRAAYRTKHTVQQGAPISSSGSRRWTTFENIELDSSDFERIGEDFLQSDAGKLVRCGTVGLAACQLMPQRALVDFAVDWLEEHRAK